MMTHACAVSRAAALEWRPRRRLADEEEEDEAKHEQAPLAFALSRGEEPWRVRRRGRACQRGLLFGPGPLALPGVGAMRYDAPALFCPGHSWRLLVLLPLSLCGRLDLWGGGSS